jgi:hypothetical protein
MIASYKIAWKIIQASISWPILSNRLSSQSPSLEARRRLGILEGDPDKAIGLPKKRISLTRLSTSLRPF